MAKTTKPKSAKKRVKVQNLPAAEEKMTRKEMKKVKGGFCLADGSVRFIKQGNNLLPYIEQDNLYKQ